MRLDILLGIVAVLMVILGGLVSVWTPKTAKSQALYASLFLLFGVASILLIVRQSNETAKTQNETQEKADHQEKELRGKLDQSLQSQEYMRGQLDTIGLMIGQVRRVKNNAEMDKLATAIVKITKN